MAKKTLLCALAALACACSSEGPRDRKIAGIFANHSLELHDPARLSAELRARGPAALKKFDPYAAIVGEAPETRTAPPPEGGRFPSGLLLGPCGSSACALRVLKNSPAALAGFRDYDRIVSAGAGPGAAEILASLPGGARELSVARREGIVSLSLERADFSPPPVFGLYDPATRSVYIRMAMFYEGAAAVLEKGLETYASASPRRLVLDLRYSRGGLPREAAAVFRLLAGRGGKCFSLASRHKGYTVTFPGGSGGRYSGLELAVLVNGGTAMAAEALAAALKEDGAKVYGSRTSGSATMVRTFPLDKRSSLKLAVARFVSPSGAELEGKGVSPQVEVSEPEGFERMWGAPYEELFFRDPAWKAATEG
ncbi:MAG: carboxyl-terminal processing protease [Elusimicrobia bacterium]|nr:MAG: carboxyl-terminal processing protease [Elusimicrobiota bacterium]KAF0157814.1 MAG: carboxyl-terminal processing protease [Elusimicrobiota bacterium]